MKIALIGDVMLGRLVNQILKIKNPDYPWGNTLPILQQADLSICNLECVLSDIGQPWSATPKTFHFRSDEKNIQSLIAANVRMVSIANNHVLDYEQEALLRMLDLLDEHNIPYAGAGINLSKASQPAIYEVEGKKIAMIAFTDNEPGWEAKKNKPGIYYVPINIKEKRAQELFANVRAVREKVDFLILSAHWGPNWGYNPPAEQIPFAHALIDAGADLIFGHSGHVFRGIEIYQNKPIIYCAGDFIDDYAVDEVEKNDESFIFVLNDEKSLDLYPTNIQEFQANLAMYSRKKAILYKMQHLCKDLGTPLNTFSDYATVILILVVSIIPVA